MLISYSKLSQKLFKILVFAKCWGTGWGWWCGVRQQSLNQNGTSPWKNLRVKHMHLIVLAWHKHIRSIPLNSWTLSDTKQHLLQWKRYIVFCSNNIWRILMPLSSANNYNYLLKMLNTYFKLINSNVYFLCKKRKIHKNRYITNWHGLKLSL